MAQVRDPLQAPLPVASAGQAPVPAPVSPLKPLTRTLAQSGLMMAVRGYRLLLSPWLGSACRFTPTCSAYALQALDWHGAVVGSTLTLWRLLRCHPGCVGGLDPVPLQRPAWLGGPARVADERNPDSSPSSGSR